jgi:hypothetical protein
MASSPLPGSHYGGHSSIIRPPAGLSQTAITMDSLSMKEMIRLRNGMAVFARRPGPTGLRRPRRDSC